MRYDKVCPESLSNGLLGKELQGGGRGGGASCVFIIVQSLQYLFELWVCVPVNSYVVVSLEVLGWIIEAKVRLRTVYQGWWEGLAYK